MTPSSADLAERRVVAALIELARASTGFDDAAVSRELVSRLAERLLCTHTPSAVLERCARRDPALVADTVRACIVNETYLFRQPEHFALVEERVAPLLVERGGPIRAWSAGCATGEEAWSLAASLLFAARGLVPVDVLATDLVDEHLAAARDGLCPGAARRGQGADRVIDGAGNVRAELRRVVRFAAHDLRAPAPERDLDLIFCRNVLLFLAPDIAAAVLGRLVAALAPGGFLVLGPVDTAAAAPIGVEPFDATLSVFRRPRASLVAAAARTAGGRGDATSATAPAKRATQPERTTPASAPRAMRDHVEAYVLALDAVERGALDEAMAHLGEATRAAPGYVPALVERALLLDRGGDRAAAEDAMREALRCLAPLDEDDIIVGPEPLPARFWTASAQAFLARHASGGAR